MGLEEEIKKLAEVIEEPRHKGENLEPIYEAMTSRIMDKYGVSHEYVIGKRLEYQTQIYKNRYDTDKDEEVKRLRYKAGL